MVSKHGKSPAQVQSPRTGFLLALGPVQPAPACPKCKADTPVWLGKPAGDPSSMFNLQLEREEKYIRHRIQLMSSRSRRDSRDTDGTSQPDYHSPTLRTILI